MERIGALLPVGRDDSFRHRVARRRHQRYTLNAEVEFLTPAPAAGLVLNASSGGMRVAIDRRVEVNELCAVKVVFTEERSSLEHCRVVWCRELPDGWVVGLQFVEIH